MLRSLACEVLLEQIDLIVLPDALLSSSNQVSHSGREAEVTVSIKLLLILLDISGFRWIKLLGPTYDY